MPDLASRQDEIEDRIEGLPPDLDSTWGDYPIDTLLIRHETRTIHDVVRRIDQGSFIMEPDFQRTLIWDEEKQSKLVESVLMRIPLPVFYLAEDHQGKMIVVDGLQRLSTFVNFISGKLVLRLPGLPELDKKRFKDISPKLQNRFEDCNLVLYIVDAKVPEKARLDIFERVNSGVPLTRQQMRNSLYMGHATRFLKDEAETELFKDATGNSLRSTTMRDREFVNRFCAFQLQSLEDYKGDMDEFLANVLKQMNAMMSGEDRVNLSQDFRRSLRNNYTAFGKHAFRRHGQDSEQRGILNASLWDVLSTGLAKIPEELLLERQNELRAHFYALMENESFINAITYSTNTPKQVRHRFEVMRNTLYGVFDVALT